ncbi:hypothetical protein [Gemmata obscuriglobus]|uniref:hypothetical protein n=1 Tax=Gemmata obscuriglobus TaxID=114 RepID=UPI0013A57885|nr:hypothetical protein [Gemmata obscuriglobus]
MRGRYVGAEKVMVVRGNRNAHTLGVFDEAFDPVTTPPGRCGGMVTAKRTRCDQR